jgi:HAD superfamily hydrolase (TIGR01450 family)
MDGTLYLDGSVIPGAREAVARMRRAARVIFLTNNSSKGRRDYAEKLQKMGFDAKEEEVLTSGSVTVDYLKALYPDKRIFLLGNGLLTREFTDCGIRLDDQNPELVVVGFDTELTYDRLTKACGHIRRGVPYIATHPDINCPTASGFKPDVGSFIALIKTSTGFAPAAVIGKPHMPMGDAIERMTGLEHSQIAMVGDRLSTDMLFALNNGYLPVLVLSGEATREDLEFSGYHVPVVLSSIAEIL